MQQLVLDSNEQQWVDALANFIKENELAFNNLFFTKYFVGSRAMTNRVKVCEALVLLVKSDSSAYSMFGSTIVSVLDNGVIDIAKPSCEPELALLERFQLLVWERVDPGKFKRTGVKQAKVTGYIRKKTENLAYASSAIFSNVDMARFYRNRRAHDGSVSKAKLMSYYLIALFSLSAIMDAILVEKSGLKISVKGCDEALLKIYQNNELIKENIELSEGETVCVCLNPGNYELAITIEGQQMPRFERTVKPDMYDIVDVDYNADRFSQEIQAGMTCIGKMNQDYDNAFNHFRIAYESRPSSFSLSLLADSLAQTKNPERQQSAFIMFKKAINDYERKSPLASYWLSVFYCYGIGGCEQDLNRSKLYLDQGKDNLAHLDKEEKCLLPKDFYDLMNKHEYNIQCQPRLRDFAYQLRNGNTIMGFFIMCLIFISVFSIWCSQSWIVWLISSIVVVILGALAYCQPKDIFTWINEEIKNVFPRLQGFNLRECDVDYNKRQIKVPFYTDFGAWSQIEVTLRWIVFSLGIFEIFDWAIPSIIKWTGSNIKFMDLLSRFSMHMSSVWLNLSVIIIVASLTMALFQYFVKPRPLLPIPFMRYEVSKSNHRYIYNWFLFTLKLSFLAVILAPIIALLLDWDATITSIMSFWPIWSD